METCSSSFLKKKGHVPKVLPQNIYVTKEEITNVKRCAKGEHGGEK